MPGAGSGIDKADYRLGERIARAAETVAEASVRIADALEATPDGEEMSEAAPDTVAVDPTRLGIVTEDVLSCPPERPDGVVEAAEELEKRYRESTGDN